MILKTSRQSIIARTYAVLSPNLPQAGRNSDSISVRTSPACGESEGLQVWVFLFLRRRRRPIHLLGGVRGHPTVATDVRSTTHPTPPRRGLRQLTFFIPALRPEIFDKGLLISASLFIWYGNIVFLHNSIVYSAELFGAPSRLPISLVLHFLHQAI